MLSMNERPKGRGPKSVTCYICGRGYGTSSIGIHLPQCEKKFLEIESRKPKKERRPLPKAPTALQEKLESGGPITHDDCDELNNEAFNTYNNEALVGCQWCGRTFLPTALERHRKACSQDKPMKSVARSAPNTASAEQGIAATSTSSAMPRTTPSPSPAKEPLPQQASSVPTNVPSSERPREPSPARGKPVSRERFAGKGVVGSPGTPESEAEVTGVEVLRAILRDLAERGMSKSAILAVVNETVA
mmetsp:Transcript_4283/g.7500  ORF Transcript_4283/g.7500 Transcript_4283/m.7500 type:complete len:246 (-) Transcript_4283:113-850(-)